MMPTPPTTQRDRTSWLVLLIVLLAYGLRIYRLSAQSLWLDETVTAAFIFQQKINPAIVEANSLAYLLLTAPSALLIPTEFGLRFPAAVTGTISAALAYAIGVQLHSRRAGLFAGLLVALLPISIHFSQDARFYSFVMCSALLTLWAMLLAERHHHLWKTLFPLCVALTAIFHLMAVLWLIPLLGIASVRQYLSKKGPGWRSIAGAVLGIGVGTGVIVGITYAQGSSPDANVSWITQPDLIGSILEFILSGLGLSLFRLMEISYVVVLFIFSLSLVLIIIEMQKGFRHRRLLRGDWQHWSPVLLLALAVIPAAVLMAVTFTIKPLWQIRYVLPSILSLTLLIAVTLAAVPVRLIGTCVLAILVVCALITVRAYHTEAAYQREDWRGAIGYLNENAAQDDLLVLCPNFGSPFEFYGSSTLPERYSLYDPALESIMRDGRSGDHRLWLIVRTSDCPPAEDGWPDSTTLKAAAERVELRDYNRILLYEYRITNP